MISSVTDPRGPSVPWRSLPMHPLIGTTAHSSRLLVPLTSRPGSDESRSRRPGLSLSMRLPTCGCGSLMACAVPGTAGREWHKKGLLCS